MQKELIIIGAGLAGSEAAWQAAKRGIKVKLYEMRPLKLTDAHKTGLFSELVCSNSLRSNELYSAPGLLKREMKMADSLIMEAAEATAVPAGSALAVDRNLFAGYITERLKNHSNIQVINSEVKEIPDDNHSVIIATGPLTSDAMADAISRLTGSEYLYFYDAIAPIIDASTINLQETFMASRYGKGGEDYLNCPMTKEEYYAFYDMLIAAEKVTPKCFEDVKVFEGCMPIEVLASRGKDTLRYGPMKPVGLKNPKTGERPYAVVQLRPENREKTAYNMVGFQTRLKWNEQNRVFRTIKGLENVEFLRYGSIHRNTFINSPILLEKDLTLKNNSNIMFAGQITGVEGYIESTAMGLIAGIFAAMKLYGRSVVDVPSTTAHGALIKHITKTEARHFQPSNINFGLISISEIIRNIRDSKERKKAIVEQALLDWSMFLNRIN